MPRSPTTHLRRLLAPLACLLTLAPTPAAAQPCEPEWLPGEGIRGVNGGTEEEAVRSMVLWDRDGPGPETARLVIAGSFRVAGTVVANNIAAWDPVTGDWDALDGGLVGGGTHTVVTALTVLPGGDLLAAGAFGQTAQGVPVARIARWDGEVWHPLGSGLRGIPATAVSLPSGDVVVGGWLSEAGGIPVKGIARWDGVEWHDLDGGTDKDVLSLAVLPGGDLLAGGAFTLAGGVSVPGMARWDGERWYPFGTPIGTTYAMTIAPNGDVIAAAAGGSSRILRWSGVEWEVLGETLHGGRPVYGLLALPTGEVIIGGDFAGVRRKAGEPTVTALRVAMWDGSEWSRLGAGVGGDTPGGGFSEVLALAALSSGAVIAGGDFKVAGGTAVVSLAVWDDGIWGPISPGMDAPVWAVLPLSGGEVIAGGEFTAVGEVRANRIARSDKHGWRALGDGFTSDFAKVDALASLPTGELVAAGRFTESGGVPLKHIAVWDGEAWQDLGGGLSSEAFALAVLANGDLIVGGRFGLAGGVLAPGIARWDGSGWHALGAGMDDDVLAVLAHSTGDIIAAGRFTRAGKVAAARVARWDGVAWHPLGDGLNAEVLALAELPGGDIVAAGIFTEAGGEPVRYIAGWNGVRWEPIGAGTNAWVGELAVTPSGLLVVSGGFTIAGGIEARRIATWDGAIWSPLGLGVECHWCSGWARAIAAAANGDLIVGGGFNLAGGRVSAYFARWGCPPCYADCDRSASLDFFDFLCFQNQFAAQDPAADCDGSGDLDFFDFLCFQNAFAAGCP